MFPRCSSPTKDFASSLSYIDPFDESRCSECNTDLKNNTLFEESAIDPFASDYLALDESSICDPFLEAENSISAYNAGNIPGGYILFFYKNNFYNNSEPQITKKLRTK